MLRRSDFMLSLTRAWSSSLRVGRLSDDVPLPRTKSWRWSHRPRAPPPPHHLAAIATKTSPRGSSLVTNISLAWMPSTKYPSWRSDRARFCTALCHLHHRPPRPRNSIITKARVRNGSESDPTNHIDEVKHDGVRGGAMAWGVISRSTILSWIRIVQCTVKNKFPGFGGF